ncbi:hypothetical protein PH235_07650 [Trichococcus sp. K1Tr]|uniref:hypothetical protein n=1 Tax=Trichococcus sp. K1Tr TaxID=3020847 RepID=UPI00232E14C1|nr:hypothetical protein [Trichococcus sp. K1Tr]MDB6353434.1 hypothetical protein [Trichococcus sp. K1Tr]
MVEEMKLSIDGIAYTADILDKTDTDFFGFQGPIELQLKRYADQEYYAHRCRSRSRFRACLSALIIIPSDFQCAFLSFRSKSNN